MDQRSDEHRAPTAIELACFDAVPAQIGIVAADGTLVAVNESWRREVAERWPDVKPPVGQSYLAVCAASSEESGRIVGDRLADLLAGRSSLGSVEYACRGSASTSWHNVSMARWRGGAIVVHTRIVGPAAEIHALREEHRLLSEAQRLARMGSFSWWPADDRVVWSDEMYRIYGLPAGNPPTMAAIFAAIHPDDRASVVAATARAREEGGQALDFRIVHPDGSCITVRANGAEVRDDQGAVVRVVGTYQDVSAEAMAMASVQRSEARLRGILDAVVDFVLLIDRGLTIEYMNRFAPGFDQERVIGSSALSYYGPETAEKARAHIERVFATGQPEVFEAQVSMSAGEERWFRVGVGPIADARTGEVISAAVIATDISEAKRTERLLRRQAEMMQKLAGAVSARESEVRREISRVLHDDLQQLLVALSLKLAHAPAEVRAQTDLLVTECLDRLSRLETEVTPLVVQDSLDAALRWLVARIQHTHGITVQFAGTASNPDVIVRRAIFDGVRELLLNVIKHAGVRGAELAVSEEAGWVEVEVVDAGAGFDPHASRATGLGLRGLKDRVFPLRGLVEIESRPGEGTRARFRLPVNQDDTGSDARSVQAPPSAVESGQRTRVLIVDDHAILRRGLVELLGRVPELEVVGEAADGREAVEQARALGPDLVLMDVELPGLNGIEATRAIVGEHPDVRVIALSLYPEAEVGAPMRQAGAVAYLHKASDPAALIDAIRAHSPRRGG